MVLGNVENMFDEAGNEIPDTVTDRVSLFQKFEK